MTYRLTRAFGGVFVLIETLKAGDARASANESNEEQGKNARKAPSKLICQHALGFRYRPLRWLSVFAETSLDIIYSRYRGDYVRLWPEAPKPRFANDTADFEGKFNPLSTLVVNVTF